MLAINPAQAPDMARKHGGLAQGMLDRRTREWRRRQELVDMFAQALGGADTLTPVKGKIRSVDAISKAIRENPERAIRFARQPGKTSTPGSR
ncbi:MULTISPECIES: hypothetical protein [unclassified Mesorhizobium]|uniref:hypothetical protein n=2 Tax=unclassified Mesorhizobium TaxID=325217 RepID=UPI00269E11C8